MSGDSLPRWWTLDKIRESSESLEQESHSILLHVLFFFTLRAVLISKFSFLVRVSLLGVVMRLFVCLFAESSIHHDFNRVYISCCRSSLRPLVHKNRKGGGGTVFYSFFPAFVKRPV